VVYGAGGSGSKSKGVISEMGENRDERGGEARVRKLKGIGVELADRPRRHQGDRRRGKAYGTESQGQYSTRVGRRNARGKGAIGVKREGIGGGA